MIDEPESRGQGNLEKTAKNSSNLLSPEEIDRITNTANLDLSRPRSYHDGPTSTKSGYKEVRQKYIRKQ